jgi:acetyl-CoA C-acetyltransferase
VDALIIDACRTPRGIWQSRKGALSGIHPQQLGATVLRESRDSRCGTAVYCSQTIIWTSEIIISCKGPC